MLGEYRHQIGCVEHFARFLHEFGVAELLVQAMVKSMRQLGIFAKYWQPGRVKTRLAASLGRLEASRAYRAFVEALVGRLAHLADRRVVAFTPPARGAEFHRMAGSAWLVEPQSAGDLGRRMEHYFESAFAAGAERVVLVGSDSPTLPTAHIERAFHRLENESTVLGPTPDGGYYLVGAAGRVPPIFRDMPWGKRSLWRETIARLTAAGCPFGELPPWYDVDTLADLKRLRAELARTGDVDPQVASLRRVVEEVLVD